MLVYFVVAIIQSRIALMHLIQLADLFKTARYTTYQLKS